MSILIHLLLILGYEEPCWSGGDDLSLLSSTSIFIHLMATKGRVVAGCESDSSSLDMLIHLSVIKGTIGARIGS